MANRYWTGAVNGGTGTWDASNTDNWSTTSGGAGGASVPTSSDAVFFDASSGAGTCTLGADVVSQLWNLSGYTGTVAFATFKVQVAGSSTTILNLGSTATLTGLRRIELTSSASANTRTIDGYIPAASAPDIFILSGTDTISGGFRCRTLDFTGFSGKFTPASQDVRGDFILSSGMSTNAGSTIFLTSTDVTPRLIVTNGVVINAEMRFDGVGGAWALQDNFQLGTSNTLRINNGSLDANNKNVTIGYFFVGGGTKTVTLGSGTWTVTGDNTGGLVSTVWEAQFGAANFTVVPGTAIITLTSANTKTFTGGGKTYPTLNQGGAGTLIIQQSNSFANITNTVQPATITFTSGTTQTVTTLGIAGTPGNLVTLNAATVGTRATLSSATPSISVSYASIKDISATGGADWTALNSTDDGNNLGWFFNPSTQTYNETPFALRSFTERRTF